MSKFGVLVATAFAALATAACSSSDDTSAPACTIAGTYNNVGTIDPASEVGCSNLPTSATNTLTITKDGDGYDIAFTGLAGACAATTTDACKIQTKCDLLVASPTTDKTTGTYQAVLTFNATGLTNTVSVSLPPNTTYLQGCSYRGTSVGTRL